MRDIIEIRNVGKVFGVGQTAVEALRDVSLGIGEGEFVAFLGPSGCGKSTLLRMIAGLEVPTSGGISVDGRAVTGRDREVGMVFQSYTSFPWLTVAENIRFGLDLAGEKASTSGPKVERILERVLLTRFRDAYPSQLSGGMQQRVAIARALAMEPRILLMDEPFGALDAMTRVEMQTFLTDIWAQDRRTIVFVTHDIDEAILLADRIVVFSPHPGRISHVTTVAIARPRTFEQTEDPAFTTLRHTLRRLIFGHAAHTA